MYLFHVKVFDADFPGEIRNLAFDLRTLDAVWRASSGEVRYNAILAFDTGDGTSENIFVTNTYEEVTAAWAAAINPPAVSTGYNFPSPWQWNPGQSPVPPGNTWIGTADPGAPYAYTLDTNSHTGGAKKP